MTPQRLLLVTLLYLLHLIANGGSDSVRDEDGGRCQLLFETDVEVDIVDSQGSEVHVTLSNENRGYKCRQQASSTSDKHCISAHQKSQSFSSTSYVSEDRITRRMCRPTQFTTVTRTVTIPGTSNSVEISYSNITQCSCDKIV